MCMDARNWDEEAYRDSIVKAREAQTKTVFRTAWAPSHDPNPDAIVVASSDGFLASYSIASCIPRLPLGFGSSGAQNCGDDGRIRGWKWKEVNCSIGNHIQPVVDLVNPQHKGPWGALSPIPENNALAVDTK
ncbi:hypothetical protein CRG98_040603, partial [Punica granatum]